MNPSEFGERCICQNLLNYIGGRDFNDEDKKRKEISAEIMNTQLDVCGFLRIKVGLKKLRRVTATPSIPDKSVFKLLAEKFRGDEVKIFLRIYQRDNADTVTHVASTEGMKIHPGAFTCSGKFEGTSLLNFILIREVHVKLIADVDVSQTMKDSVAQKVLEAGSFSDVIISAGNGAEIKSHKAFLSVRSPVLKAMLTSGMGESQTGRVDMSDLSEKGVNAFLRYVYCDDMQEPKVDIKVAFELYYAGHKYDVPGLEDEMMTLFLERNVEDIDVDLAFKLYMFTRNIESAVELKTRALQILQADKLDPLYVNPDSGEPTLESEIESFLAGGNDDNFDVALAFKMYVLTRNIESAVELKNKAFKVVKANWRELESLREYNDLFVNPSNAETAKELFSDLAATYTCTCTPASSNQ